MKKILALVVSAVMVLGIATISFAAPKSEKAPVKVEDKVSKVKPTEQPKVKPTAKPVKVKAPAVKKPEVKKPVKSGNFVIFAGTTTAKAHIRVLVAGKTVASGLAGKNGEFKIKVESKKLKSEVTIYAYTNIKGKIAKSEVRKVQVPVTLLPSPSPTPTVEPTVEPTLEPTLAPTVEPTIEPTPEVLPTEVPTI